MSIFAFPMLSQASTEPTASVTDQAKVTEVASDEQLTGKVVQAQTSAPENDNQTTDNSTDQMDPVQFNNNTTTNTSDQTTTQSDTTTQPAASVTEVDGVFTVGDNLSALTDQSGTQTSNRSLAPHTAWYTDKLAYSQDGQGYYRVSTLEYISANAGTFVSNIEDYNATVNISYKKGSSVHSFSGYGDSAVYTGNDLPTDTSWKTDKRVSKNGKYWYEIGHNLWVPQDYVAINDAPDMKAAAWVSGVPLIAQRPELPNGCEITAVTMMLQYAGANVDKMQLAREMPRNSDPNYDYIGQPWDQTGITIFPNALMDLVEKYAGSAKDLTGVDFNDIKYQIDIGHPVVTWNTLHGFTYHALTVTGYDDQYVYYNDCWTNQSTQMGIQQFLNNWDTQSRRAISY